MTSCAICKGNLSRWPRRLLRLEQGLRLPPLGWSWGQTLTSPSHMKDLRTPCTLPREPPGPRGQGGRSYVPWWLKGVLGWPALQAWEDLHFSRWARQPGHTCVKGTHPKLPGSRHRPGRGPVSQWLRGGSAVVPALVSGGHSWGSPGGDVCT